MAPTTGRNASSSTLSMKLLVNTKTGRVLYAEAGKDVVDFLFSLLTLLVGAVVKMLSKDAMVCIGNLYSSVEEMEMDSAYIRCADARDALLSPPGGYGSGTRLLQLQAPAAAPALEVFQCSKGGDGSCYNYVTVPRSAPCRLCRGEMNVPIEVVGFSDPAGLGFVKEVVTYTVMDDLKVAPLSTVSVITLLNALGVTDISSLQEMTVRVGYAEGLEMLRASLQSKAVLTDVFLRKKNRRQQAVVAAPSNKKRKLKAATLSKAMLIDVFLRKKSTKASSKKKKGKGCQRMLDQLSSTPAAPSSPEFDSPWERILGWM